MKKTFPLPPHLYDKWFSSPEGKRVLEEELSLMEKVIWPLKGTLLDIGCGTGIFTSFFQKLGFHTFGLDLSLEMLLHFKKKGTSIPLIRGDACLLPMDRDSLDYASLITVLEFLEYPLYALAEATRIASRGVLIAFLPPWAPTNLKRRIKGAFGSSTFSGATFLSSSSLITMVKEACRINSRKVREIKVDGCLFPGGIRLLPLASFAVVRVDYE